MTDIRTENVELLTLPSKIRVSMTIVGTRYSHIIRQKSSTELSVGPERQRLQRYAILAEFPCMESQTL
jgi:hypothetical protein